MSGGPPHHPHARPVPPSAPNSAWNHLQVPNYYPRQPQHAHMSSNEHSLLQQPTWHTPTTEPPILKTSRSSHHIFSLEQMLSDQQFNSGSGNTASSNAATRTTTAAAAAASAAAAAASAAATTAPGVDLSMVATRNGGGSNQNGEQLMLPAAPISLSVRDTNKINSLSVLEPLDVGPGLKPLSPGCLKSSSVSPSTGDKKRLKRVDSILERLNPNLEKSTIITPPSTTIVEDRVDDENVNVNANAVKNNSSGVIVASQTASHDENSNTSSTASILNVPSGGGPDESVSPSPLSNNEDSLDGGGKSRRKRKPSKTVRVAKDSEDPNNKAATQQEEPPPAKTRRKSSECETIDSIAAMVQEGLKESTPPVVAAPAAAEKPISVSVITKTGSGGGGGGGGGGGEMGKKDCDDSVTTSHNTENKCTQFVEVENKLEEMFAGIEEVRVTGDDNDDDDKNQAGTSQVTSTSSDHAAVVTTSSKSIGGKKKKKQSSPRRRRKRTVSTASATAKKKAVRSTPVKTTTPKKAATATATVSNNNASRKSNNSTKNAAVDLSNSNRDVYAYDSGSNTSSQATGTSKGAKGPFIQIRGPRDSPLSVNIVNTVNDDGDHDPSKTKHNLNKSIKIKKYHDDSEYRHKVRSKGLHCSTLSNRYDAQTKDATWICSFCKRGPHSPPTTEGGYAPGDLFGPYFITANSPEFGRRLDDPFDKQFKSKKIARSLDMAGPSCSSGSGGSGKKVKQRKYSESKDEADIYLGITATDNDTYEVWAHEDCIVWSSGAYLIGPKIVGLQEAVWTGCGVRCCHCQLRGANIACLKRGCLKMAHVCCGRAADWLFDEDNYKSFCPDHRV